MLRLEFAIGASQTGGTTVSLTNMWMQKAIKDVFLNVPDFTNAITFTFSLYDAEGIVRFTQSNIAKNAVTRLDVDRIVHDGFYITITPSAAGGSAGTIIAVIEFKDIAI